MDDMICGKLLGDGCLTKQQGRKPRFQFIHCKRDVGWSQYCYEQLSPFLPLSSPKYRNITDSRIALGFTESYIVQSRTSEEFCRLYKLWYPHAKKQLPFSYIEEHLNERTLAWWYQDDGHLKQQNGILKKIILSTDSFSPEENKFLIQFLQNKYHLIFSLDGQNRLILYDQFQIIYFLKLVDPYIHESMNRKRRATSEPKPIADRTTIYLPSNLVISKPTLEINNQYKKLPLIETLSHDFHKFFIQNISLRDQAVSTKPYQIQIDSSAKLSLENLKQQTGLNISQITALCFQM